MKSFLRNKHIIITGGTGTLGKALVTDALDNGARVYCSYCNDGETAKQLERLGAQVFPLDLADKESIVSFIENISTHMPHIDALINNAIVVKDKTILNLDEHDWDQVIAVGLTGPCMLIQKLIPLLERADKSRVINITSQVGLRGGYGQASYAAAKGGLIALTGELSFELGAKGIRVHAVNPGFMHSRITDAAPDFISEGNRKKSCLGTYSDPFAIARNILQLLSEEADMISGQVFHFDSRVFPA